MGEPTMLEQLLHAMDECKAVIREAHEATRDLKQATKEARETFRELQRDEFEPWIRATIAEDVERMGAQVQEATRRSRETIISSFERLSNLLMYGNEQGRGEGLEPNIRKVARERHANGDGP